MSLNSMGDDVPETRLGWRWAGILFLVALALLVGIIIHDSLLLARINKADDQVVAWADRLAADKDENGNWKKWPAGTLPESDPWGHPLRVRYEQGKYAERIVVSSDGPDGRQWNDDDLDASAHFVDWMKVTKDGAKAVEEVAGAATRGAVGGAIEGVTDHIPKQLRDKAGIPSSRDKKDAEKK